MANSDQSIYSLNLIKYLEKIFALIPMCYGNINLILQRIKIKIHE